MSFRSTLWPKLKVFAAIEVVLLLIALVVPITPSKTGSSPALPATVADYAESVLLCFVLGNAIVAVVLLVAGVWTAKERPASTTEDASPPHS